IRAVLERREQVGLRRLSDVGLVGEVAHPAGDLPRIAAPAEAEVHDAVRILHAVIRVELGSHVLLADPVAVESREEAAGAERMLPLQSGGRRPLGREGARLGAWNALR